MEGNAAGRRGKRWSNAEKGYDTEKEEENA